MGSVACCTHVLDERECRCVRSPRIPLDLELLGACGKLISPPESLMRLMGSKKSKRLLPCPKAAVPAAGLTDYFRVRSLWVSCFDQKCYLGSQKPPNYS